MPAEGSLQRASTPRLPSRRRSRPFLVASWHAYCHGEHCPAILDDRDVGGTEDGSTAAVGDYAGQARKALENLRAALTDASASIDNAISTRISVASAAQGDLSTVWEVVHDRSANTKSRAPWSV